MKKTLSILLTLALLISTFAIATTFNALAEDGWELVWNDEFSGSSVDTTRWDVFNTSKMAPRAGYTEFQEDNAIVKDGKLIIQNEIGGCEPGSSARFTSARLMTMDMFKYGKFEIRAKCAEASGTNSAFWTWGFPNDPNYEFHYFTKGKGSEDFDWRYGEIDVIERFNYPSWGASRYRSVYSQLHFIGPYKDSSGTVHTAASEWGKTTYDSVKPGDVASWLDPGVDYGDTWHTFGFEWDADSVKLFRDGVQYGTLDLRYTSDTYPTAADAMDVFRKYCQKIILSDWLGGDTVSGNSTFQIDYLRIWQKPGCYINYNEYGTPAYNAAKKVQTMDTKLATHTPYYYQPELKGNASYKIFDADASSITYPSLPQNASADSIATHGTRKALKIKRGTQYDNVCVEFPGDYSTVAKNAKYLRTWVAAEDGAMYYANQKGGISYGFRTTDGKYYFANGEKGLNYCASNVAYSGNYYWVDLSNLMLTETGVHKYTATDGRVFGDRLMDVKGGQTTPFSSIAGKIDAVYVNFGVISGMGTATGVNKCYFIDDLEFVNDATVPPTSATTQPTAATTATPTSTPTAATTAAPTQSTTSSSDSTKDVILDWSKYNGYSGGGFSFTKDDPTGYVHVSGSKTLNSGTQIADLLNWWGWTAAGYDKIQFTAYTASGSCDVRMYFDGQETANTTITSTPTAITYDVPATTKTGDIKFQIDAGSKGATVNVGLYIGDVYGINGSSTTVTTAGTTATPTSTPTAATTAAPTQSTTSSSGSTKNVILDWSNYNGYSGGGFSFTKDDPTGYVHVSGSKTLNSGTQIADLLNWWGWTAAGYDKIQFTAYTASGSCDVRMYFDGQETANTTITSTPTVITYDVPATTKTGDIKFQLDAGEKGATVNVDLYIGDVYGIKGGSETIVTTATPTAATTQPTQSTTSSSGSTKNVILDWSNYNGYSGGGFSFTKDDPTGFVHVSGSKTLNTGTQIADLLNWWGWTAAGYDKIQFTAYTASGSCDIRMYFDGQETANATISSTPTVITYDVPATTKTGDIKFQLDAGEKGATVNVDLYIGDVYGIKISSEHVHTPDASKTKVVNATCVEDGYTECVCSECGETYTTDVVPATGVHTYTETVDAKHLKSEANCVSKAVYYKTCSVCGHVGTETFEYGEINANNHSLEHVAANPTTHALAGNKEHWKCANCSKLFSDANGANETTMAAVTIAKLPYVFGDYKSDETKHWRVCTTDICGEVSDEGEHTYGKWVVVTEATETKTGLKERTCTVCGYKQSELIPFVPIVTEPTTAAPTTAAPTTAAPTTAAPTTVAPTTAAPTTAAPTTAAPTTAAPTTAAPTTAVPTTIITPIIYGDANGDGIINLLDLIAMRKHLAKWSVNVDKHATDCNADGNINLLDLILLRKYLAKWNVVLGPQA